MGKNYVEIADSIEMLSGQKWRRLRYWRLCCFTPLLVVMAMLLFNYSAIGQNTKTAEVVAAFGVDGDVWAAQELEAPAPGFNSDDWFGDDPQDGGGYPGWGVIDATLWDSSPSTILGWIANHQSFEFRMSVPRWSQWQSDDGMTYEWIDGVYGRDNVSVGGLSDSTTFTGTKDKNAQDPHTWNLGIKGSPQKNDLVDIFGYIRQRTSGDEHRIAYGAASTISADGSSHTDFEFFRRNLSYDPNLGVFGNLDATTMGHTAWTFDTDGTRLVAGDLVFSTDFEKGGKNPTYSVRVWIAVADGDTSVFNHWVNRPFDLTGIYDVDPNDAPYGYFEIAPKGTVTGESTQDPDVWATVNVSGTTAAPPWGTLAGSQGKVFQSYLQYQITEVAIDLTAFGLDTQFGEGQNDNCVNLLGTLIVKTRSSQEFTAELKDFAGPYRFGNAIDFEVVVNDGDTCDNLGPVIFRSEIVTENIDPTDQNWSYQWYQGATLLSGETDDSLVINTVDLDMDGYVYWLEVEHVRTGCTRADSAVLTVHENPTCEVLVTDESHFEAYDGTATVVPSGGTAPYTYFWEAVNGGSVADSIKTDSILTGLGSGVYIVTVTDAFGCVSTCNDTIDHLPTAPTCEVFTSHIECFGAADGMAWCEITPNPNGAYPPYTYYWSKDGAPYDTTTTSSLVDTLYGLEPGVYTAEVYDAFDPNGSFCGGEVTQEPYKPLELVCFPDTTLESCQTQAEIDNIFSAWLTNFTATGGTDPLDTVFMVGVDTISLDTLVAPDKCGGEIEVYIYLSDYCGLDTFCSGTFTVPTPEAVSALAPGSIYYSSCDFADQTNLDTTFQNWLDLFVVTNNGGCDSVGKGKEGLVAPDVCLGDTVNVVYSIYDGCTSDTVRASFGVSARDTIDVDGPASEYHTSCEYVDQNDLNAKFKAWIDKFVVLSNECNVPEPDLSGIQAPDVCLGDTIDIVFGIGDLCTSDTVRASFGVSARDTVDVEGPQTEYHTSCDFADQVDLDTTFANWLAMFKVLSNECNVQEPDLSGVQTPDLCSGDTVNIVYGIGDLCTSDTVRASFGVSARDSITVSCNSNTLQCDAIDIAGAYQAWVDGFTYAGGCVGKVSTNIADVPLLSEIDLTTGGTLTFNYKAWDDCTIDSVTCTFTLPACEECETAYGVYPDSICFLDNTTGYTFSNWGWSNHMNAANFPVILDVYAGNSSCDIISEKMGEVTVSLNNGDLVVHYVTFGPFYMSQIHLNVNCWPFVVKDNGGVSVSPGQYSVNITGLSYVTDYTITIPASKLGAINLGDFYLIAHAVACYLPGTQEAPESNSGSMTYNDMPIPCVYPSKSGEIATAEAAIEAELAPSDLKVYPNPFTDKVTFEFVSGVDAYGVLEIYNITGQKVARILDRPVEAGVMNRIEYAPEHGVTGMYLYRLDLDGKLQMGRIIYKE
ncbi:T9SS type A sorting domain-containing protein [Draconibacterium sp.]|uniref:T9SS type A sorting domain-containing protein n=1 Tax=Draconibacterium sp. TaxID=1965318 RepID=UPI0035665632